MSIQTDPHVSFSISFFTSFLNSYITDSKTATRGLTKPGAQLLLLPFHPTPAPNPSTFSTAKIPKPNISNPNCKSTQRTSPSSRTPSSKRIYSRTTSCICDYGGRRRGGIWCLQGGGRQRRLLWMERKWGEARRSRCTSLMQSNYKLRMLPA